MSKRLQIILDDAEMREIQWAARQQRLTVAAWVRQVLRAARRRLPKTEADRKLAGVRAAVQHAFPTADLDRMIAEIERGYLDEKR